MPGHTRASRTRADTCPEKGNLPEANARRPAGLMSELEMNKRRLEYELPLLPHLGHWGRDWHAYHRKVLDVRECAQCGTPFTPRREHARFCSARCRMTWNREHAGIAAAPAVAIDWSVTAMTEAARRLSTGGWDLPRLAPAVGEAVWWVTLVDATLVRYHPRDYEAALAGKDTRRREVEETLEGLRYVRNQLGKSADPAKFIHSGCDGTWRWRGLPHPGLATLAARARQWELSRYRAYQARLVGDDIARTFARCTEFLTRAAAIASGARPDEAVPG
jgi:endogenous inhibitor of DNA gyrase (YacG/DUF329 family)